MEIKNIYLINDINIVGMFAHFATDAARTVDAMTS